VKVNPGQLNMAMEDAGRMKRRGRTIVYIEV